MTDTPCTILITGASSGLGAALAEIYAAPGVRLILHGRDAVRLDHIVQTAHTKGATTQILTIDVRDATALSDAILDVDQHTPIDLVIANAGVSGGPRDGVESAEQIQTIFDINIQGVMNTITPLLPRMIARGRGQIAIMSSLAGFAPWPGAPAYAASKACVRTYGLALRTALQSTGVCVNVICPGFVDTPMTRVNPYHMPFLMDSARAARIMKKGLARNQALITFPWQMALMARTIGLMPVWLQEKILAYAPAKPDLSAETISR